MANTILALARSLHIGSAMMLVALSFFALIVLRPVFAIAQAESYLSFEREMTKWLWLLWTVEAVSGIAWFWLVAAGMADKSPWRPLDSSDLATVLWQTQFGQLWLGRLCLGIFLGWMLILIARKNPLAPASWCDWSVMGISTALLTTLAWAGHAAAGIRYYFLHLGVDIIHLLIGSIWPMGLIPLGIFLGRLSPGSRVTPESREIDVLFRFSGASLIAVLILIVTGFINGCLMIGSWDALVTTTYGELLLAKVFAVALMIGLGAWNRLYLLPRARKEASSLRLLRRTILTESGLAGAVLLIVGIMGMTSPPSQ